MFFDSKTFTIYADNEHGTKAAAIFSEELRLRTGCTPEIKHNCENVTFGFILKNYDSQDEFSIEYSDNGVLFFANGIRGFIYAFSVFLKKCRFTHKTELTCDISGKYSPVKSIRGHQLGYRTTPNSYDAWSYEDYRRYYLDLMFMGCNMVEHIPYEKGYSNRNRLMKYDEEEFLVEACRMADEINLDVSLWYPNRENEDDEKAAETRKNLIKKLPRVNVIFPPGGDPGSLPADVFVKRCIAIKEVVNQIDPDIEMWPSAQAPHEYKNWGEVFIESLKKTDSVDGIIMGPNHAYPIEELRRKVPAHLPIRFYPDITHNVRCEYPVHFDKDDWHYALCAGLGRECTNPRPMEYAHLHSLTKPYVCGSVSYSEGITDDVNKFIWSSLDFGTETDVREILLDYARLFFYGAPEDKIADAILCLEIDWACDPALNPTIESTYNRFVELREKYSFLNGNWRFDQLLFRAECDMLLRTRRIFENNLVKKAKQYIKYGKISQALTELETDFCDKYKALRKDIDRLAEKLFNEIGLQLDVENYCANSWERGAVLETIDLPVTDRAWLIDRIKYSYDFPEDERKQFLLEVISRNKVDDDEFYYSVAESGIAGTNAKQTGEIYMNVLADRPDRNNGTLPTCMFKIFDNYSFRLETGGFTPGRDYRLIITFTDRIDKEVEHLRIFANGHLIFDGPQLGGILNKEYDEKMLCNGFATSEYLLPADVFENGCLNLLLEEENVGIMLSELRIIKK